MFDDVSAQVIGEGEFGSVYKGSYMTDGGQVKDVAIKALSSDTIEPGQSDEFLREAKVRRGKIFVPSCFFCYTMRIYIFICVLTK